jgi:D-hexose-6-phosphate mutarotase
LLADIKNKKLFLVTKINYFGSAFYGNSNISSTNNVILSPIDPLMIFINIFFYTTCQNKIENYRNKEFSEDFLKENFKYFSITDFTTVSLGDMLTNYYLKLQNNSKIKKDLTQFDQNKLFVDSFLKVYLSDNEQKIELIAEKSYSKNL